VFRKSVSFFILIALFWVLLWVYLPDQTPGAFSFTDLLRGMLLVFSLMAFGFALLMLIIRYWGLAIASRLLPPQGALLLWLGKHAYEYSQPKVILLCQYVGQAEQAELQVRHNQSQLNTYPLKAGAEPLVVHLGMVRTDPQITWYNEHSGMQQAELPLIKDLQRLGRNVSYRLVVGDDQHSLIRQ
jgi:hypothetical protein